MNSETPRGQSGETSDSKGIDVRDLTLVGKFFGLIAILMVIAGAISIYILQPFPRYFGLHIYGTAPAVICAIPLIAVAIGFFKGSQLVCEYLGLRFARECLIEQNTGSIPDELSDVGFPCSRMTFQERLSKIATLRKLVTWTLFIWSIPVMVTLNIAYDKWIGARSNGLTDLLKLVLVVILAFGPIGYLRYLATSPSRLSKSKLLCPKCRQPMVDNFSIPVIQSGHCPVCGERLIVDA